MTKYQAPLRDMKFLLNEVLEIGVLFQPAAFRRRAS
jgi:hypothetical protein